MPSGEKPAPHCLFSEEVCINAIFSLIVQCKSESAQAHRACGEFRGWTHGESLPWSPDQVEDSPEIAS
jgi:hypothetical protein